VERLAAAAVMWVVPFEAAIIVERKIFNSEIIEKSVWPIAN
jgi:hypothetical protein